MIMVITRLYNLRGRYVYTLEIEGVRSNRDLYNHSQQTALFCEANPGGLVWLNLGNNEYVWCVHFDIASIYFSLIMVIAAALNTDVSIHFKVYLHL